MLRNPRFHVAALLSAMLTQAAPSFAQPNIVFIMADDLGWTDTSNALTTLGNPSDFYETPGIDLLAAQGMSFTNAYANPTCAPTRSSILSGAYGPRPTNNIYTAGSLDSSNTALLQGIGQARSIADTTITHAETLQSAGYTTGYVGKFHVTASSGAIVTDHGFAVNYGGDTTGGPGQYHATGGTFGNSVSASLDAFAADYTQQYVDANIKPYATDLVSQQAAIDALVGTPKHLTDASADAAITFMDANLGSPFYLQYSPHAVHTPVDVDQARTDLLTKYQAKPAGVEDDSAPYAALIEGMDQSVARLVDYLETTPDPSNTGQTLDQNTVLIFYSDNGGATVTNNSPLDGQKSELKEGGIRVPMIAWSGNSALVDGGTVSDEVVMPVDFYTTFASLAVATLPTTQELDGVDLSSVFADSTAEVGRDSVFWHFPGNLRANQNEGPQSVIRTRIGETDWKLTYSYEDQSWELYDLDADIDESDNLSNTNDGVLSQLGFDLLTWLDNVDAPLATVRSGTVQVDVVGSALAYANGGLAVYTDQSLTFNAGEQMPLFLTVLPGDLNFDKMVSFSDFNTLANNYNGPSTAQTWATGDFDGDGDVTFSDFNLLANNYGYDGTAIVTSAALASAASADFDAVAAGEAKLIVGLDGSLTIEGDNVDLNGFSIRSASGQLITDADGNGNTGPFQFDLANDSGEVSAGIIGSTVHLDGLLALDAAIAGDVNLNDLVFEYGTAAGTIQGVVEVVPEPSSLALLGFAGLLLARRRRR